MDSVASAATTAASSPTAAELPPPPPPKDLARGQAFRGFEILDLLGRGGMGVVYRAKQTALDRVVALKVLPRERAEAPGFSARFEREAKALAALSHPNIVGVFDFGKEGDTYFLAMEFVDGTDLRKHLAQGRPPVDEVRRIMTQLCDALDYAHKRGVVHRDIKPENILIDREGRVRIADFGLAKIAGPEPGAIGLTQSSMAVGTLRYMAPEQMENSSSVDHRADLFSAGVVLYELLTGEHPVGRFDPPSKKSAEAGRFDIAVLRALEKDPSKRPQSAREFSDLIRAERAARSRRPLLWAGVAAAIVVPVAALVIYLATREPESSTSSTSSSSRSEEKKEEKAPPKEKPPEKHDVPKSSFENLRFEPSESPLGRSLAKSALLKRNPFFASEMADIGVLIQFLYGLLRKATVKFGDIREGMLTAWEGVSLLALVGPCAERVESDLFWAAHVANRWAHREGDRLVIVYANRPSDRDVFVDLVLRVQDKLGIPRSVPDLPIENLVISETEVPAGLGIADRVGTTPLPLRHDKPDSVTAIFTAVPALAPLRGFDVRRAYLAGFGASRTRPTFLLAVLEIPEGERAEEKLRSERTADSLHLFRVGKLLVALVPLVQDRSRMKAFADEVRRRVGPGASEREPVPEPEVRAPEKTPEIDRLEPALQDGPLGRDLRTEPGLARNPLRAATVPELTQACAEFTKLTGVTLPPPRDLLLVLWEDCGVLAISTPEAERLAGLLESSKPANRWTHRNGALLVFAFGTAPEARAAHVALVDRLQEKLGLPREAPPARVELAVLDPESLPVPFAMIQLSHDVKLPLLARTEAKIRAALLAVPRNDDLRAEELSGAYAAGLHVNSKPYLWIAAYEFVDVDRARVKEGRLRGGSTPWIQVLRSGRLVVVITPADDEVEFGENDSYFPFHMTQIMRRRLGM